MKPEVTTINDSSTMELLLNTGSKSSFLLSSDELVFNDDLLKLQDLQIRLNEITRLFKSSSLFEENSDHLVLSYKCSSFLLIKNRGFALGLIYTHKPKNILEIIEIAKPFLDSFITCFKRNIISEHYDYLVNFNKLIIEENSFLINGIVNVPKLDDNYTNREGGNRIDSIAPQFELWLNFQPYLQSLLAKVMNLKQSERLIHRVLSRKGLDFGVHSDSIGHVAREIILEIPHKKKRKQLLSELHDILLSSGVEKQEDNVIGFTPQ